MVALKRKRQALKRVITDKASRYPPSFLFSALTYKQAPEALSISPQSILVSVPTQPNPTLFNTISGDIFSLHNTLSKKAIKIVEEHHKHHTITHLQWNQKGNTIASIDETGNLALWHTKGSVNDWELTYKVDTKQPLAAFLWLNSDRSYGVDSSEYKRESFQGPRNPFGQLGFITITVHGEITVHYQRNGSIFSTFSTPMPNIGRREISRADAGCFGMSLAGLDDWERISHAAITLHEDGQIYLATHNASIQPKSVSIHTIKIKFPVKSEKGAIECKPITSLKIQGQDLLKENNVTQMVFKKGLHTVELVLGLGDEVSDGFNGFVTSWQLKKIQQSIPSDFGTITNDRTALVYQSGTMILGRFISCLTSTSTGQIIVGLSDGSIHAELALQEGLVKSSNMEDTAESIDPTYWTVVGAHKTDDGCIDPIADIVLSPNETHLLYIFSSSKIGIARITNDDMHDSYVKELIEKLQLCLLNNVDFMDLISELVRMSKQDKDQPEDIINQVLTTYEIQCGESPLEPLENWSLANLEKGYGLAMAAYRRLPDKKIASVNLSRAIQLPVILECFMASCTTDYEEIIKVLEKENIDTNVKLEFDPDSLWSLISVSTWIRDYLKWILREWNMLFNCISPADSSIANITEKPAHAVLLLHKDSRISLSKILKMLHYFVQYTSTASFQLETFSETQGLLQRYTSTLMTDDMIMMKDTIDFLNALNDLEQKPTDTEIRNRWSILLTSNIKTFTLTEIKKISNEYKDKCAKPSIYLEKEDPYEYDVIRKRRIPDHVKVYHCVRCQQPVLPMHTTLDKKDPCSSAQWYQSLGKQCICGGYFH